MIDPFEGGSIVMGMDLGAGGGSAAVVNVTKDNFLKDVIERSDNTAVVVDFWAPWCGPCQSLGPMLERLARESRGKFVLAKINVDDEPELAGHFEVQSIPAVFGIRNRQVRDTFEGALPESAIKEWLAELLPSPLEDLLFEAKIHEASDPDAAFALYEKALALAPADPSVTVPAARFYLQRNATDACQKLLDRLDARGFLETELEGIKAQLHLRQHSGDLGRIRAEIDADPKNTAKRLELAEALAAVGDHLQALNLCLELVETDRAVTGEAARKCMVDIFQSLPPDSPIPPEYQRKLAMLLF